jgi:hypothetical protein
MRFSKTITLAFALMLACGTARAANYGPYPVTYLKGNIEGLDQNAGGTLDLTNTKVLKLQANDSKLEVPYSAIFGAERKEVVITVEKEPLYKVWALPKRLAPLIPPHEVSFDYKDKTGNLHSITLEMEPATADRFFGRLKQAETKKAATRGDWWGDSVWKTHRNEPGWNAQHDSDDKAVATR